MIGFGKPTAKTDSPGAAVAEAPAPGEKAGNGADKRRSRRIRTSLRTGQLYDMRNNFLCDCQVRDRSVGGAKLRLMSNISLPTVFKFHDDVECTLVEVELRWRNKNEIGVQFTYTVSLG
ncbi:PilZ domain-containing protein [Methyloferula stellata]|jgi:hypothetical protein|uniref:PilZ domain-containing protein n=1 Tax=Methyloferula stellata TaxID=876270 RepID=UPI0003656922|nr:PilZ domain-containing protein [Methyloferula stellata]